MGCRTPPLDYKRGKSNKQVAVLQAKKQQKPLLLLVADSYGRNIVHPQVSCNA